MIAVTWRDSRIPTCLQTMKARRHAPLSGLGITAPGRIVARPNRIMERTLERQGAQSLSARRTASQIFRRVVQPCRQCPSQVEKWLEPAVGMRWPHVRAIAFDGTPKIGRPGGKDVNHGLDQAVPFFPIDERMRHGGHFLLQEINDIGKPLDRVTVSAGIRSFVSGLVVTLGESVQSEKIAAQVVQSGIPGLPRELVNGVAVFGGDPMPPKHCLGEVLRCIGGAGDEIVGLRERSFPVV